MTVSSATARELLTGAILLGTRLRPWRRARFVALRIDHTGAAIIGADLVAGLMPPT